MESAGPRYSTPLHGLRGLAALIVVFGHAALITSAYSDTQPTLSFANSSACVVLFFVLSGLVLAPSASVAAKSFSALIRFYIRRIFRLMPLMIVVNIFAVLFVLFVHPLLSFPDALTGGLTLGRTVVSFFGATPRVNGPSWSIFVELCASALMPLIMLAIDGPYIVLGIAASLALASLPTELPYHANIYLLPFSVGAALHRWSHTDNKPPTYSVLLMALAIISGLIFYISRPAIKIYGFTPDVNNSLLVVAVETLTVAPGVWLLYNNRISGAWLSIAPIRFLGDVSYGLYLVHFNVVIFFYNVLRNVGLTSPNRLMMTTAILSLAISLPLAWVSHRIIELPGIKIGARLSRRVSDYISAKGRRDAYPGGQRQP